MPSHIDWSHHTVDSLRELCREYQQQAWYWNGMASAHDAAREMIEHTPYAFRVWGILRSIIDKGYDDEHICQWLLNGLAQEEAPSATQPE